MLNSCWSRLLFYEEVKCICALCQQAVQVLGCVGLGYSRSPIESEMLPFHHLLPFITSGKKIYVGRYFLSRVVSGTK
jgi:hypothetical protein